MMQPDFTRHQELDEQRMRDLRDLQAVANRRHSPDGSRYKRRADRLVLGVVVLLIIPGTAGYLLLTR
jgi:hypothetical protein